METVSKRIDYVDFMKAAGMMAIIWGHIMLTGISNRVVYAFHIPLFFFLSGLMFKREKYASFKLFLLKRIKSLLLPYFIFSFLTWIVWTGYSYGTHANVESYIMPFMQTFIAQGSGGFLIHNVPLWFVTCLFVVEVLYYFISKLSRSARLLVCILCGIAGCLMTLDNSFFDFRLLPWNMEVAFAAIPFYALGSELIRCFSHRQLVGLVRNNRKVSAAVFFVSLVLLFVGASYNGQVSMGSNHLGNFFVFYPTALCGIAVMFILCVWWSVSRRNLLYGFFQWFGRNTFTAMAVHNPIKGFVVAVSASFVGGGVEHISSSYLYSMIAFCISFAATCIAIVVVNFLKGKLYLCRHEHFNL